MSIQFKNSLSVQLLKKVFIIYFSITIVMTFSQIAIEIFQTQNTIKKELASLEEIFTESLNDAIWNINVIQIKSIATSIYKLPFVKEISIIDNSGNNIINFSDKEKSSTFFYEFNIFKNYDGNTLLIAKVKISSNMLSVIQRVEIGIYLIFLSAFIKSIILVSLFLFIFKIYLIKPLNNFTKKISDINFENIGEEKIHIDVQKESELYILQKKFNQMIDAIANQKNITLDIKNEYLHKLESEVQDRTGELVKANKELLHLATTDYLTNIRNRRSFYDLGENYFSMSRRYVKELFIIAIDLDNFKHINDKYGHTMGDNVLKIFAKHCQKNIRDNDVFGRVGGEEFNIVLYDTSFVNVEKIAYKILSSTADLKIPYQQEVFSFTVSIGIANIQTDDTYLDDVITRADKALYLAKNNGRNRVEIL